jgi:hypothetical protein
LDVAHTLLFNTKVPKHFWGDVLTACQLINHMPSAVLNHRSSFSLLYPDRAPFPLTCLVVLPLFMSLILTKISYPPGLMSVFCLGTLMLRRAIVVTVLSLVDTLVMLSSLI